MATGLEIFKNYDDELVFKSFLTGKVYSLVKRTRPLQRNEVQKLIIGLQNFLAESKGEEIAKLKNDRKDLETSRDAYIGSIQLINEQLKKLYDSE